MFGPPGTVAEIRRVREQGWAIVDQEREQVMRSAAAPIRDVTNQVVAVTNVSVLAASTPMGVLRMQYLSTFLRTAAAIQADLASESAHARAR
jgi:IclR family pca regulon transcriptional regulator